MLKVPEIPKGDENFWEWNPQYVEAFDDTKLYKSDKSKNKTKSSGIMWAFYHKLHPDSTFYNMEKKEEFIKDKFIKDLKFDWKKVVEEEARFKDTILTQAERGIVEWDEVMRKRGIWIKDQEYSMENAKDLDTILANTAKLYQLLGKVKKEFEDEKVKRGKGNKPKSSSDANRI